MNEKNSEKVESFALDHTKVKAPFVRKCTILTGEKGDKVTKFDIRFMQPNAEEMESDGIHTLEHLLAVFMRDERDDIIDLSPMGCRTGFYMTVWGEPDTEDIKNMIVRVLKKVGNCTEVPAQNPVQCGNYKLHSLERAKQYANKFLSGSIKVM